MSVIYLYSEKNFETLLHRAQREAKLILSR